MEQEHELNTKLQSDEHPTNANGTTPNVNGPGAPLAQDIFANDEVAFLLDEIRELEPPACCNDNDQEYEIAGSQADLDLTLQLDSPYESSWYHQTNKI